MVTYTTNIYKFDKKGEKSGWTYIEVPADIAAQIKPKTKVSFKVKGKIDQYKIKQVSLLPMGNGSFIMPLNGDMRKQIRKKEGAMVTVTLSEDKEDYKLDTELVDCIKDDPAAFEMFSKFTKGTQNYYSKWVQAAKTDATRVKRIAMAVSALSRGLEFGAMLKEKSRSI
ncbi:MAG: YdeI/OmpD-associated family protein [Chitinophagaceae bacterium]|uniref:DUF1905 domain-containing protein n=1 Tax=unclassified Paraflavitalea TaxID=2798305 RepID=UPI003D348500|nr:YdeI/OmpD-associated family protein [Chitinophagaceae bacterium]